MFVLTSDKHDKPYYYLHNIDLSEILFLRHRRVYLVLGSLDIYRPYSVLSDAL